MRLIPLLMFCLVFLSGCWKAHLGTYINHQGEAQSVMSMSFDGSLMSNQMIRDAQNDVVQTMKEGNYKAIEKSRKGNIYKIVGEKKGVFDKNVSYKCTNYWLFKECTFRYAQEQKLNLGTVLEMPQVVFTVALPEDVKVLQANNNGYEIEKDIQRLRWRYEINPNMSRINVNVQVKFRL